MNSLMGENVTSVVKLHFKTSFMQLQGNTIREQEIS